MLLNTISYIACYTDINAYIKYMSNNKTDLWKRMGSGKKGIGKGSQRSKSLLKDRHTKVKEREGQGY